MISLLWRGASQAVLVGKKQKNPPDAGDTGDEGRFSSCPEQTVKAERGGSIQLSQADSVIESRVILGMQPRIQSVQSCLTSRPHRLQHARPPCRSPTPGIYSNLCPSRRWCHPIISSSVVPFSSRLQSFSASGSFPMSRFFTSGGQSIGVAASASVLPMNI